jgi:hypothetical protein
VAKCLAVCFIRTVSSSKRRRGAACNTECARFLGEIRTFGSDISFLSANLYDCACLPLSRKGNTLSDLIDRDVGA